MVLVEILDRKDKMRDKKKYKMTKKKALLEVTMAKINFFFFVHLYTNLKRKGRDMKLYRHAMVMKKCM